MRMLATLSFLLLLACEEPNTIITYSGREDTNMEESPDTNQNTDPETDPQVDSLTFLALGDSYTIGQSVAEPDRWPVQLQNKLINEAGIPMSSPKIIAQTGMTTAELKQAIGNALIDENTYDLVSLLIGVNNQYRSYNIDTYKEEFPELLDMAMKFAGNDTSRVFVVSIPDYGVTPFGKSRDQEKIRDEVDLYNSIAKEFADARNVKFFDITPISREADEKPELVAGDDLHPSARMYWLWVNMIYPWAKEILDQ